MSPHAARLDEAIEAIWTMIGWAGGYVPVWRRGDQAVTWHDTRLSAHIIAAMVQGADERRSEQIAFGLPHSRPFNGGCHQATVLWCFISGSDQLRRARAFRPLPSLVLQEGSGSRRLLLWSLRETADYYAAESANRKIAYALHAVQKHSDPDALRIPAPGTCLREGRVKPTPVVVARLTTADYTARAVTEGLREPPPKDAWRETAARRT
jgi:hypothetical protein